MKIFHTGSALVFLISALIALPAFASAITFIGTQNNIDTALNSVSDVAVSIDGKFVYTASTGSAAIAIFRRDVNTGGLVYVTKTTGSDAVTAAFSVDVSPDNKNVYAASPTGHEIVAFSRNITTGELTLVNRATNTGGTSGFVSVSVSPDGKSVYGVGGSPSGLVVFERDEVTGAISVSADYKDNENNHSLGQLFNASSSPIKNIATSKNGSYIYVTSTQDHAVTVFERNISTGKLTQLMVYKDGVSGVDGLLAASSIKISPDGKHAYVTGQSANSVAIFSIDEISGELNYISKVTNGVAGVNDLLGARSLAISPDGKLVYVSAITSDAVTVFDRDSATGLLTFNTVAKYLVDGVNGLDGPSGMATDSLNRHLYVAGQSTSSLVIFSLPAPAVAPSVMETTVSFDGSASLLDPQLIVLDNDSSHLVSAIVSITNGFVPNDALFLASSSAPGVSVSYDAAMGVLTLTGSSTVANYQAMLRTLSFRPGAEPSLLPGSYSSRAITMRVSDGVNLSAISTINLKVGPALGPSTIAAIPTLSEWSMIGMAMLISAFGWLKFRRRKAY